MVPHARASTFGPWDFGQGARHIEASTPRWTSRWRPCRRRAADGVNSSAVSCLFCEIVAGKIPAKIAYQDDDVLAFHDIDPKAPTHVLVVPQRHITSLLDLSRGRRPR